MYVSKSTKPETTVRMKTITYERYKKLGKMGESWDDLLSRQLVEQPYINNLKEVLLNTNEKSEKARKEGLPRLMKEAYDALNQACQEFINEVENR